MHYLRISTFALKHDNAFIRLTHEDGIVSDSANVLY